MSVKGGLEFWTQAKLASVLATSGDQQIILIWHSLLVPSNLSDASAGLNYDINRMKT